jgi:hypothetical protein
MSTIKTINVIHPTGVTNNIVNDNAGNVTIGNNLTVTGSTTTSGNETVTGTVVMGSSFLRNYVINGDMRVAQRGTSAALPVNNSSTYTTLDRFCSYCLTGQTGTSSQVASGLTGFQYALRLQRTASNTSTANIQTGQALETINSIPLAGQSVTFSFYAKAGANFSGSGVFIQFATGTGTDQSFSNMTGSLWTGQSNLINFTTQAITTTWTRYTFTVSVASTATQIGFQLGYTPSGTAGASDFVDITGVQIEVGSVATPFERRQYGQELALCQRYFCKSYNIDVAPGTVTSVGIVSAYAPTTQTNRPIIPIFFPVTMRTTPTVTAYSPNNGSSGNFYNSDSAVNFAVSSIGTGSSTTAWYPNGSLTVGVFLQGHWTAAIEL